MPPAGRKPADVPPTQAAGIRQDGAVSTAAGNERGEIALGGAVAIVPTEVLAAVAAAGAEDAGGLDVALLGDYLPTVVEAAASGRRLNRSELEESRDLGAVAAEAGVPLRSLMDLYLSSAWRLWEHLPAVRLAQRDPAGVVHAGQAMLRAVDDAVAALAEGYQLARRRVAQTQEQLRQSFVDALLEGGDVGELLERGAGFGLTLTGPHVVAVATRSTPFVEGSALVRSADRALHDRGVDAESIVVARAGLLVAIAAVADDRGAREAVDRLTVVLGGIPLGQEPGWQLGVGQPGVGPMGVRSSYEEATEALDLAGRLGLTSPVVHASDLLIYTVLLRDRSAVTALIERLLSPLLEARGGAAPLLETLAAYFAVGGNTAAAARRLHLSVRAVTYRLDRIAQLTGQDPADPANRFGLQAATLGAQLLGWPEHQLPSR